MSVITESQQRIMFNADKNNAIMTLRALMHQQKICKCNGYKLNNNKCNGCYRNYGKNPTDDEIKKLNEFLFLDEMQFDIKYGRNTDTNTYYFQPRHDTINVASLSMEYMLITNDYDAYNKLFNIKNKIDVTRSQDIDVKCEIIFHNIWKNIASIKDDIKNINKNNELLELKETIVEMKKDISNIKTNMYQIIMNQQTTINKLKTSK